MLPHIFVRESSMHLDENPTANMRSTASHSQLRVWKVQRRGGGAK